MVEALQIGHNRYSPGAINYLGENEYFFNKRVSVKAGNIPLNGRVIELHFNASYVTAYGCEALVIEGDIETAKESTALLYLLSKKFDLRNRGVKYLTRGDRGYTNLVRLKEAAKIAFILEPCFNHESNIFLRENEYAEFLAEYLQEKKPCKKSLPCWQQLLRRLFRYLKNQIAP